MQASKQYRPFKDARDFARGLNLNGYMEWLEFDGEFAKTTYYWETIEFLSQDDRYIFVFISKSQFVALPKRVFTEQDGAEEFCGIVRMRTKLGSEQSPPAYPGGRADASSGSAEA